MTTIFSAPIHTPGDSHDRAILTAEHSFVTENEVFLRLWKDGEGQRWGEGIIAQANLTPRQALRLAHTLQQMAEEARGFTAWDRRNAGFIGWYYSEADAEADLASWPSNRSNAVVLQATRREVLEAIDSLKYHGKWDVDSPMWHWAVMDEVNNLALTGD
jgi:hypothetical protein